MQNCRQVRQSSMQETSDNYFTGKGLSDRGSSGMRHFLHLDDFSKEELKTMLKVGLAVKKRLKAHDDTAMPFSNMTLAMIFTKPSSRTRVSFETGFFRLGGHPLYLGPDTIQLGKREPVKDVARTLSRYNDVIMARVHAHTDLLELAAYATCPVINGLSDYNHPCQIMGDVMTIHEIKGRLEGLKVACIGDGDNVLHSWLRMATRFSFTLSMACPKGFEPDTVTLEHARQAGVSTILLCHDPTEAVKDADVVYTDVWTSMGQKEHEQEREQYFKSFQVNAQLMKHAKPDAIFMHCLPAERGKEVSEEVIESEQSVVFQQAENRMHSQMGILMFCLGKCQAAPAAGKGGVEHLGGWQIPRPEDLQAWGL